MARNQIDYQHKNPTVPKIAQLNVKGRIFDNQKDIAERINDFFANIGPNTETSIPKVPVTPSTFLTQGTNSIS